MQTRGAREEGYLARCERRRRVRELAQTERAREQQQRERRGKRATSEQQQPEREGKTEGGLPAKITSCPESPPAKHQTTRSISHVERSCRSIS